MKTMLRLINFISLFLLMCACDDISENPKSGILENVRLIKDPMYSSQAEDSYLPGNYGVYLNYFSNSDNIIGLSASKPAALNSHRITGYSGPRYAPKTKAITLNKFDVTINGKPFSNTVSTKSSINVDALFGGVVQFSIYPKTLTKSGSEASDIEMYVPQMINIIKPSITKEEELLPLCYYDGFVLGWNADQNNRNGVVIIVEWMGNMVIGSDIPDTHIRRTCIVEDNGECVLSNSMFDGIPDTAVCHLTILRGNIEKADLCDESFNIMAESHEFMNFILIREIKEI